MPSRVSAEAAARELLEVAIAASEKVIEKARTNAEVLLRGGNGSSDIKLLAQDIAYIKVDVAEIKSALSDKYVTMEEYRPVKNVVFGMVGLFLTSIVGAILALVLKSQ